MKQKRLIVTGGSKVLSNFIKKTNWMTEQSRKGLQAAGLFIKEKAQEQTPHDMGDLVNSAFYSTGMQSKGWMLRVGYTAEYAAFVHEMPDSTNWSKSGTGNKFLSKAVGDNENMIIRIIKNRMKF